MTSHSHNSAPIQAQLDFAGSLLRAQQLQGAEALLKAVLGQAPRCADALNMLGALCLQQGRAADAEAWLRRAVQAAPDSAMAHNNLGVALEAAGDLAEACACHERALQLEPDYLDALNNLGNVYRAQFRYAAAAGAFARALAVRADLPDVLCNYGRVLFEASRDDEALRCYERALTLAPAYAEAHWNAALCHLWRGDFTRGWQEYEWRWRRPGFTSPRRNFAFPSWLGEETLQGRTLLLHAEQGLGDSLQFLRYVSHVRQLGAEVILEVQPALKRLCLRALPDCTVLAQEEALPAADFHCPLLSLPLALSAHVPTIPEMPALAVDPELQTLWRERLQGLTGLRVGLAWAGNPKHWNDCNRSLPLQALLPLRACTGVSFVSLQKDVRPADRAAWAQWPELFDAAPWLDDFADTAALIRELDLVICVDSAVAHLAGALGGATWILLSAIPEWRWQKGREDSAWYPAARLYQQTTLGDWGEVLEQLVPACSAAAAALCEASSGN